MNQEDIRSRTPEDLNAFWMPFTANRQFKKKPRLFSSAKGMYYTTTDNRKVLDACAGLWCCNLGHGNEEIEQAVTTQLKQLDYAPSFQMGHPLPFVLAKRLISLCQNNLQQVFFTNSGSEAVDTALKIALAYHQLNGNPEKTRLIGREKSYHGVGFGGISVGGMINNRKNFGGLLPDVDHLPHTLDEQQRFSKGLPEKNGVELANGLTQLVQMHGASTIAAVIVEPVSGSAGVVVPPKGYLQRLREICDQHDILLIFDEVITGFGRLGGLTAAQRFDVKADIITLAKGLTNGCIPMGAVLVDEKISKVFMNGDEDLIELFHGYTYSGHPVASAAALASLNIYQQNDLFVRVQELESYWEQAIHSLADLPGVIDIRNIGLMAGVEFDATDNKAGRKGYSIFTECFHHHDLLVRASGDTIALSPPLIISEQEIDQIIEKLSLAVKAVN